MVKFLRLRGDEIRSPGGTLILAFPCQSEDDHRVWWGLGLAMRDAFLSAAADGYLDNDVVLRHGNSMGTRTVEQVHEALEQVKDVWSIEHLSQKDALHPGYSSYLEACVGAGEDQKRDAYVDFARTLVEMTYAVYTPFLLQAIRKAKNNGSSNGAEVGASGANEEKELIEKLKHRSLGYYCEREMGSPFWIPYIYVRLGRK
ncbi:putative sam dependent carboxyl methyltransferase family protein [Diaporthe ampelina]|uniref:Putative sam dependent carboxyl methyltransferase family protein n=1 Tax=Diaporthe ampelina TaxID=1214573 RepID=A0A0G2FH88_9PEZI|nr:putative sam dependent carboxyl methyltransferase family protein [Diaporthe ampelina]